MARDSITRTGARTRGVERHRSLAWRCSTEQVVSGSERRLHAATESTKDGGKLDLATGMLGASLTVSAIREGPVREASFGAVPRENPPYGILWGTMETAASFEVRNAPSSYPTRNERASSADAFDLVMRARAFRNRGTSRENYASAANLYEQALQLSPEEVQALTGLSVVLAGNSAMMWSE